LANGPGELGTRRSCHSHGALVADRQWLLAGRTKLSGTDEPVGGLTWPHAGLSATGRRPVGMDARSHQNRILSHFSSVWSLEGLGSGQHQR